MIRRIAGSFAPVLLSVSVLGAFLGCKVITVSGVSMEGTLLEGDRLLVVRTGFPRTAMGPTAWLVRRGTMVVFSDPMLAGRLLVKRVVAVGGDRVRINRHGSVIVNGQMLAESPYIRLESPSWPKDLSRGGEAYVPASHYFVLADNRITGLDSRIYGPVRRDAIVGVVVGIISRPVASYPEASRAITFRRGS